MRAPLLRRSRPGRRAATAVLLLLATFATFAARSLAGEPAPTPPAATPVKQTRDTAELPGAIFSADHPLRLTPPALFADPALHPQLAPPTQSQHNLRAINPGGPVLLNLDISLRYLRLAVHGDYRPGILPFLGTSTTALGGLRLRF